MATEWPDGVDWWLKRLRFFSAEAIFLVHIRISQLVSSASAVWFSGRFLKVCGQLSNFTFIFSTKCLKPHWHRINLAGLPGIKEWKMKNWAVNHSYWGCYSEGFVGRFLILSKNNLTRRWKMKERFSSSFTLGQTFSIRQLCFTYRKMFK